MFVQLVESAGSHLTRAVLARRERDDQTRPAGLHLSTITDDWMKTVYPAKFKGTFTDEQMGGYQECGNAYEDLMAAAFTERFARWTKPAPRRHGGVWCSPDGESLGSKTIDEMKATWISSKDFLTVDDSGRPTFKSIKFIGYEIRIKCYLAAWGWTRARLHVWFVNGAYPKGPPAPEWPRTYILRYSQAEVREGWRRMMQHARDRRMITRKGRT